MDEITRELFYHEFIAIIEEMSETLRRASFSQRIKEGGIFSCGIFTYDGEMIAYLSPSPLYLSVGTFTLRAIKNNIPEMNKGDVYIINDPFKGGTDLSNITLISPVFTSSDAKKPSFFVITSASHSEMGTGSLGGVLLAKSIVEEGIFIEPIKLIDQGKMNESFLQAFFYKVSYPKARKGDLNAQILSNFLGVKKIEALVRQHGLSKINKVSEALINYSEYLMKKTISSIPNGEYKYVDYLDSDGLNNIKIKIKVSIKIDGEKAIVNFSRSNEVVRGPLNAVLSITTAVVFYVFRTLAPSYTPLNSGCLKPIEIICKKHTILNASYPSAVTGGATETAQRIVDVLLGALSIALPNKIPSASQGTMNGITITGFDKKNDKRFTFYETIPGGVGAGNNYNAPDALQTHMMNTLGESIEEIEYKYPIKIKKYEIRSNSGGQGIYKGGDGVIKEYKILCDAKITIMSERRLKAPYGLKGGKSGKKGNNYHLIFENDEPINISEKIILEVKKGDSIIIETPGGGGWGKCI
jgi:N-methylhydantoinase B